MKIKHAVIALIAIATAQGAYAQGGTNSPYSQYGLGALHDGATSFNRGMNGLGIAFRGGPIVNPLNPASYSAIDSLTFIFDVGMSGQITNFEQNNKRINANNASIEYAVASFRAFRHVGMSFGLLPYSTIGYNYSNSETISPTRRRNNNLHQRVQRQRRTPPGLHRHSMGTAERTLGRCQHRIPLG